MNFKKDFVCLIVVWFIIASQMSLGVCLECYSCSNSLNMALCQSVVTCAPGQTCFKKVTAGAYTLGCGGNATCMAVDSGAGAAWVGRRSVTSASRSVTSASRFVTTTNDCSDCCHTSMCNKQLCQTQYPSCHDSGALNCHTTGSLLDLCKDTSHAAKQCKMFCGLCAMVASPCVPNPCIHGTCGVQSTSASGYSCTCNMGYTGVDCDTVDPCASRQCLHGKCNVSSAGAAVCVCDAGYKGAFCDTDVDECASSPCQHGSCMDQVNDYVCTCSIGYTGKNCDTATATPCSPNPCVHGTCGLQPTSASGYTCTCNTGYTGANCTATPTTSPCASSPCVHGRCVGQASSYTCQCDVGYYEVNCDKKIRDCRDVLDGHLPSPSSDQFYTVKIGLTNKNVRCDMTTDGGGWTVIMNREADTINFTKDSTDYALGFGNSRSDFWIGLEDMHRLTSDGRKYQMRVELTRGDGSKYWEVYDDFSVGARPDFVLYIGAARGTAGDALRHHDGYGFTTVDHDVDSNKNDNCAQYLQGAWWFHECYDSCLTCPYETPGALNKCRSMSWNTINYCEALKAARMLVRPM